MTLLSEVRIWVVLASLAVVAAAHAQDVKVRGRTVKTDGAAIAGVSVQAFRQGEAGKPVKSDPSGEYVVELGSGAPIARIEYRHSHFDHAEIAFVSGSDSQQRIVKVMFVAGQPRSVGATADTLAAYEQFVLNAFIAQSAERQGLASLAKEFDLMDKVGKLPIKSGNPVLDAMLERRRKDVVELLGKL